MSIDESCNISISTSLDRGEVEALLMQPGRDDLELSDSAREVLYLSVWPWHVSHWPREEIGSLPHLEVRIWGFGRRMEIDGLLTRTEVASHYASRIIRLRNHAQVEAGLAKDSSYAAWTFWSPDVIAVVDNVLPSDPESNRFERVKLANSLYVPEIARRYEEQSIPFERRIMDDRWEIEETPQHSLLPLG